EADRFDAHRLSDRELRSVPPERGRRAERFARFRGAPRRRTPLRPLRRPRATRRLKPRSDDLMAVTNPCKPAGVFHCSDARANVILPGTTSLSPLRRGSPRYSGGGGLLARFIDRS